MNCLSSCIGPITGTSPGFSSQVGQDARTWVILQRFSGHYVALVPGLVFVLIWGLVPACSVVFFPLSAGLFLPLAGLFSCSGAGRFLPRE